MMDLMQALAYTIFNLCSFPEYIEPLRAELETVGKTEGLEKCVLLDSFLRESARFSPMDAREFEVLLLFSPTSH